MTASAASLMPGVPELLLASRETYGYQLARSNRALTIDAVTNGESVLYPALHLLEQRGRQRPGGVP